MWAFLTIEDICSGTNDTEIRKALEEIPTDLPTTFDRALSRIAKRHNQKIASKIFGWTTAARQPLTLTQLQEALSVKVGQRNLHPDDLVSGMDRIAVWCENLVCVEETDNMVHFSHHSIREYLLQPKCGHLEEFDHHAGEVCITYLNLENLNSELIESESVERPTAVTATMEGLSEQTVRTAVGGSMGARLGHWTSHFVKSSSRSVQSSVGNAAIHSTLRQLRHSPPSSRRVKWVFLEYAEDNWFRHRTRLCHSPVLAENGMWNLVGRLLWGPRRGKTRPWDNLPWRESIITEEYLQRHFRERYGPFVPFRGLFVTIDAPARSLLRPADDLSPDGSLPYLAVYAAQNNHESLACRAFIDFLQRCPRSPMVKWITLFLALEGNHSDCRNRCFSRLNRHISHQDLVEIITLCVAAGVSHWPASDKAVNTFQLCQCSENRFHDFCELIPTGYNTQDLMRNRDFAFVALCSLTKAGGAHFPAFRGPGNFFEARTSSNMTIVDIAAEQDSRDSLGFLVGVFDEAAEHHHRHDKLKTLALGGLCTALQSGSGSNAMFLLQLCVELCNSEHQLEDPDIIRLYQALCNAATFTWSFDTAKDMFSWFFDIPGVRQDIEARMYYLVQKSVNVNNWEFAGAVVDAASNLEFNRTESKDPFYKMILDALGCQRCRTIQYWPQSTDGRLSYDRCYKLCSKHQTQALATLDPDLYLTPDKRSLRRIQSKPESLRTLRPKSPS